MDGVFVLFCLTVCQFLFSYTTFFNMDSWTQAVATAICLMIKQDDNFGNQVKQHKPAQINSLVQRRPPHLTNYPKNQSEIYSPSVGILSGLFVSWCL